MDAGRDTRNALRDFKRAPGHIGLAVGVLSLTVAVSAGVALGGLPAAGLAPVVDSERARILSLVGLVGGVPVLGALNATALQLARLARRRHEVAVRMSLGASAGRLVRQFAAEGVVLASISGAGAALLLLTVAFVARIRGWPFPVFEHSGPGGLVMLLLVALFVCLLATALVPALRVYRASGASELSESAVPSSPDRLLAALVVVQVSASVVLVGTSARLFNDVLDRPEPVPEPQGLSVHVLRATAQGMDFNEVLSRVTDSVLEMPSIRGAAFGSGVPRSTVPARSPVWRQDGSPGAAVETILVSPGFFALLGTHVEMGRVIEEGDSAGAELVAVPSTTLAEQIWGRVDPTDSLMYTGVGGPPVRVVGLVREPLPESGRDAVLYLPAGQHRFSAAYLLVRSEDGPEWVGAALDGLLRRTHPGEVTRAESLSFAELVARAERPYESMAMVAALAGTVQLILMAVGLFGVVLSFAEARRVEIGLRRAVGATGKDVFLFMLRRHAPIVAFGLVLAGPLTWFAGRVLAGGPGDVREVTPLFISSVVLGVALIAALARPSLQAMRAEPLVAIRGHAGGNLARRRASGGLLG